MPHRTAWFTTRKTFAITTSKGSNCFLSNCPSMQRVSGTMFDRAMTVAMRCMCSKRAVSSTGMTSATGATMRRAGAPSWTGTIWFIGR